MDITVNGSVIVHGDQILDGGIKIVHEGSARRKKQPLTEKTLKENVDLIRSRINNGRLWFSVCKHMMWQKLVPEGDFQTAADILQRLYPGLTLNAKDLSSLNVQSFRKHVSEWTDADAPVSGTTFNKYMTIALTLEEML